MNATEMVLVTRGLPGGGLGIEMVLREEVRIIPTRVCGWPCCTLV